MDARFAAAARSPAKMQEPEIFEQPVASKDVEALPVGDDHHTYQTAYTYQTNNTAEDSSLDDYHDFVYPEGEFSAARQIVSLWSLSQFVRNVWRDYSISTTHCLFFLDHFVSFSQLHSVSHRASRIDSL